MTDRQKRRIEAQERERNASEYAKESTGRAKGKAVLALHRAIDYLDEDNSKTAAIREMLWAIDCLDGHRPLRYSENAKYLRKESTR